MKKRISALSILLTLVLIACKNEPAIKNYVTLSGKVTNPTGKELKIIDNAKQIIKTISLQDDGSFKDTLKVSKGIYTLFDGNEYATLFLENNYDISITLDTKEFDETLTITGNGSEGSNYFAKKVLLEEQVFNSMDDLFTLEKSDFLEALEKKKVPFTELKSQYKNLDSLLIAVDTKNTEGLFNFITSRYDATYKMAKLKGTKSPKFVKYENNDGGTTSLDDLKGKYVYIDVWATWCGPCKREIPFLKEVEKEFHNKNIAFVSISIDKKEAHATWKDMIKEKELGGIQLFADDNWNSKFIRDYNIEGIPRFILIDPQGNIFNADAPRPSSPRLKEIFNKL